MKGLAKKLKQLFTFSNQTTDEVPLVCPGYLPLDVQAGLKLTELCRAAGLPEKAVRQAAKQMQSYKNN